MLETITRCRLRYLLQLAMVGAMVLAAPRYIGAATQEDGPCPGQVSWGDHTWTRIGSGFTKDVCVTVGGGVFPGSGTVCQTFPMSRYQNEQGQKRDLNCSTMEWD